MAKYKSSDVRVFLATYEPGTAMVRVSVVQAVQSLDPTVLGDLAERVLPGLRQDKLELGLLFDDGTSMDAAAAALIGSSTNNVVSVYIGAPTATGGVAYCGTGRIMGHQPESPDGKGLVQLIVPFIPDQSWKRGQHYIPVETVAHGGNGAAIDNSVLTTAGGTWFVHVTSVSGLGAATGTLTIQDSADGTTYVGIGSMLFTTATSGVITASGTIRRYTRYAFTGTTGATSINSVSIIR